MQMQGIRGQAVGFGFGSLLLGLSLSMGSPTTAQSLSDCQPPRPEEYLLLVPNQQSETLAQLQRLLPNNAILTPCNYLGTAVVRVEGFSSAEIASAWAQYLVDTASVQSYVARPPAAGSIATAPTSAVGGTSSPVTGRAASTENPSSPNPVSAFAPQPLGTGYAVVVDYFNRPELASKVKEVTARDVGLVAFEQQPYLLASFTTDPAVASSLLRTLSEQGLTAAIIDSRRAMLLTPAVKLE